MAEWKVGDVVQLKSGGPVMTVESLTQDGNCWCTWFVNDEITGAAFPPETLRKAPSGRSD